MQGAGCHLAGLVELAALGEVDGGERVVVDVEAAVRRACSREAWGGMGRGAIHTVCVLAAHGVCLSTVCLSIRLSVCPCVCLPVCLSVRVRPE